MARTKAEKFGRVPRLFWHEIPLQLSVHSELNPHQLRDLLEPLIQSAILRVFPGSHSLSSEKELIRCDEFWIGPKENGNKLAKYSSADWFPTRIKYRFDIPPWMQSWNSRRLKRLNRPRSIEGYLAQGEFGNVSLFLARHWRWKGNRYLVREQQ